jgi:thymidylate synthase (FAD)
LIASTHVLDDGFVDFLDVMGSDADIAAAARVSTGSHNKGIAKDTRLLRYLWENKHHSPFEMAELKFHVRAPVFVARQWFRHRTGKYNEQSQRYKEIDNSYYIPEEWRMQDGVNKQSSNGVLGNTDAHYMRNAYIHQCEGSIALYHNMLNKGVAREMARMVLPVSMYTEFFFKMDLRNLLHFLDLRLHEHAQKEIRDYAVAIEDMVARQFPLTMEVRA